MNRRTLLTSLLSGLTAGVAAIAGRKNTSAAKQRVENMANICRDMSVKTGKIICRYEGVLLEREYKHFICPDTLHGFLDHDLDKPACFVSNMRVLDNGLYGDITSFIDLNGLYPSLSVVIHNESGHGRVESFAACKLPNVDSSIKPIRQGNGSRVQMEWIGLLNA